MYVRGDSGEGWFQVSGESRVRVLPLADAARSHPTLRKEGVGRPLLDYKPSFLVVFMRRGIV